MRKQDFPFDAKGLPRKGIKSEDLPEEIISTEIRDPIVVKAIKATCSPLSKNCGPEIDKRQYPRRQEAEKRESFEVNVIHYFLFDIQFAKGLNYRIYKNGGPAPFGKIGLI